MKSSNQILFSVLVTLFAYVLVNTPGVFFFKKNIYFLIMAYVQYYFILVSDVQHSGEIILYYFTGDPGILLSSGSVTLVLGKHCSRVVNISRGIRLLDLKPGCITYWLCNQTWRNIFTFLCFFLFVKCRQ